MVLTVVVLIGFSYGGTDMFWKRTLNFFIARTSSNSPFSIGSSAISKVSLESSMLRISLIFTSSSRLILFDSRGISSCCGEDAPYISHIIT